MIVSNICSNKFFKCFRSVFVISSAQNKLGFKMEEELFHFTDNTIRRKSPHFSLHVLTPTSNGKNPLIAETFQDPSVASVNFPLPQQPLRVEAAKGDGVANIQSFQCLSPEATVQGPVSRPSQHSLRQAHVGLAFGALITACRSVIRLVGNLATSFI